MNLAQFLGPTKPGPFIIIQPWVGAHEDIAIGDLVVESRDHKLEEMRAARIALSRLCLQAMEARKADSNICAYRIYY